MKTRQHTQESLTKAFVYAVAAKAKVGISDNIDHDYGIDGEFRPVIKVGKKRFESGFILAYQLKSTVNWKLHVASDSIIYDVEADTYNSLASRDPAAVGCVLILLCLPKSEAKWVTVTHDNLLLRNCCYWYKIPPKKTKNKKKQRILIPRANLLTPSSLKDILVIEADRRRGTFK